MLIKSQYNKVFNLDNMLFIEAVEAEEETGIILIKLTNNELFTLGQYEDVNRAEEIIDEILEIYCPMSEYTKGVSINQGLFLNTMPKRYKLPEE